MEEFEIPTKFIFDGVFKVKAKSLSQAIEYVDKHCGMVIGVRGIHSSLPEEDVDWDFPCHPEKEILT